MIHYKNYSCEVQSNLSVIWPFFCFVYCGHIFTKIGVRAVFLLCFEIGRVKDNDCDLHSS